MERNLKTVIIRRETLILMTQMSQNTLFNVIVGNEGIA